MPAMEKSVEYEDLETHREARRDRQPEKSPKFKTESELEAYKKSKPKKGT